MPVLAQLPGRLVEPREQEDLRRHVAFLCKLQRFDKFPGSQPVSFTKADLTRLEKEDYWVCEKSDGIRVIVLIAQSPTDQSTQDTILIDRHNNYRHLTGFLFPHHNNPKDILKNTILDGELVVDVNPKSQTETVRLLLFDCLVIDNENVMSKPLTSRYGRLREYFYTPYAKMLHDFPQMAHTQPFEIAVKPMKRAYHVEAVFEEDIPQLQHGHDGLIYTCAVSSYVLAATDNKIMKWKPPSENSIDFKLVLKFPPVSAHSKEPDFYAKPVFGLHVWAGGSNYEPYDVMRVTDEEWEDMKRGGEQYDDRIVEVHWDTQSESWRMMRFRDDKPNANFRGTVEKIIQSIRDGVEKEDLFARSAAIRSAWEARNPQQAQVAPQPQPQPRPPIPPQHAKNNNPPYSRPGPTQPALLSGATYILAQELRYGPLASSAFSKVGGPPTVVGVRR